MRAGIRRTKVVLPLLLSWGFASCDETVVTVAPVAVVEVTPVTGTVAVGENLPLAATLKYSSGHLLSGRTITWSTSNPSVATVNGSGLVSGVAVGSVTITASSEGRQGSATVTVTPAPVATVSVSPPSDSVAVGETLQLSATTRDSRGNVLTGRTVTWASSDTLMATVSATGLVTGIAVGVPVTISATSEGKAGAAAIKVISGLGDTLDARQFALIQPGTFQMGDVTGTGYPQELPVHKVNITKAFYLQKTEVTQVQWRAVMGTNPSAFSSCGDTCPVESVSWNDIQEFLAALNQANPGANYRLPTEAEWEYAARAGTTGDYGGNGVYDDMAWWSGNSGGRAHPVGEKRANAWGLYDMHGNVWEKVEDWYSDTYYSVSPANDPTGPPSGTERVMRGGAFYNNPRGLRSAYRLGGSSSTDRYFGWGFRLARTPEGISASVQTAEVSPSTVTLGAPWRPAAQQSRRDARRRRGRGVSE